MLAFAGWEKVDRMARSLGVAQDDPRRQVAAVEACLYQRLDAKHTLTPHEDALGWRVRARWGCAAPAWRARPWTGRSASTRSSPLGMVTSLSALP